MRFNLRKRPSGSVATVLAVGVVLGLLAMLGLAILLDQDRRARIAAAERQALALSTGVDRLLQYGLKNIERSMAGIAADAAVFQASAPEHLDSLLRDAIAGVVQRNADLASIVLVDAQGRALSAGDDGDEGLPESVARARSDGLVVGTLQEDGSGGWWLRLALPFGDDRWLLARLDTAEIERMIHDLDVGRDGHVTVLDRTGVILARMPSGDGRGFVGRPTPLPPELARATGTVTARRVSPLDGVERLVG